MTDLTPEPPMVIKRKFSPPKFDPERSREEIQQSLDAVYVPSQERTEITLNALRLLSDASLLYHHKRYASSFALALLAWEEVGKLIIDIWQSQRPLAFYKGTRLTHRRKQAAASFLLVAKQTAETVKENYSGGSFDDALVDRMTEKLMQSDAMTFAILIERGIIDRKKELALYRDQWLSGTNLHVDLFELSPDKSMLRGPIHVLREVLNTGRMERGRELFESYLERETETPQRRRKPEQTSKLA